MFSVLALRHLHKMY